MRKKVIGLSFLMVCLLAGSISVQAQSVKGVVKSTVNHFRALDLEGTWSYEGTSVKFETDNLLKKAGGMAAASKMEKSLNEQLDKLGFEPGITSFTFNEDGTFANETKGRTVKGTYTYDSKTNVITLKYVNHIPVKATLTGSGNQISLLFEAGGFLSMISFIGSHSGVSIVKSITSLFNTYDGMMAGMELKRK